jgi:hypothetical protein
MVALLLPSRDEIRKFLVAVSDRNPGLGIFDKFTGKVYLACATALPGGDHASLVEREMGISDIDDATHVRGFVVGRSGGRLRVINVSGLNPLGNQMEPEVFQLLLDRLDPYLREVHPE